jgi:hypothetical protein
MWPGDAEAYAVIGGSTDDGVGSTDGGNVGGSTDSAGGGGGAGVVG